MSATTGIQWTDATWNPVVGCTQVSPGCAHCYAKQLHDQRHKAHLAGKKVAPQYAEPFETVQLKPERLRAPLSWRQPKKIFVNSVADLFHDAVPFWFIDDVFNVMRDASWHTFQVLTKRPERMLEWAYSTNARFGDILGAHVGMERRLLPNVWLGVSVENQRWANERIPLLQRMPAAVRFLSCEPLLGPLDFEEAGSRGGEDGDPFAFSALTGTDGCEPPIPGIDWVIVGGESGRGARPMRVEWVRDIQRQCASAGVPLFVKQMGAVPVASDLTHWNCGTDLLNDGSGSRLWLRDRHGADVAQWPAELRVREFPASGVRA